MILMNLSKQKKQNRYKSKILIRKLKYIKERKESLTFERVFGIIIPEHMFRRLWEPQQFCAC